MSILTFCNVPYTTRDIPLGSLVINLRHPVQGNVTSSNLSLVEGIDYSCREQQNFNGLLEAGKNTSFWAQISTLLSFNRERSKTESIAIEAVKGKAYELKSPEDLFKKICRDKKVQSKLVEQAQHRCDTFFIVGWRTFLDSKVEAVGEERARSGAAAKVPAGEAIKANFGVDVADAADIKAGGESSTQQSGQESFGMQGEFVYAIQYRKVKAKTANFEASTIDRDGFWRVFTDNRGLRTKAVTQVEAGGMLASAESDGEVGVNFEYYEGIFDNSGTICGEKAEGKCSEPPYLLADDGEKYFFPGPDGEEEEEDEDLDEDMI